MLACPGFPVLAQGLTCQSEYDVAANLPNALVFASLVLMLNSSPANTLICFSFGDIRASVKELVVMKGHPINSFNVAEFLLPALSANYLK